MRNKLFTKIYGWMFIGLLVSFITGYYISTNMNMVYNIFYTNLTWILLVVEIIVVIWLSAGIKKMNPLTAKTLFVLYSILTGTTLSSIFIRFRIDSIIFVFAITALMFGIMAIFGATTKIDLTKIGTILFVGLIGIVITSIVNIFILSETINLITCIIGVVIFTIYIAYDVNKIKYIAETLEEDKAAIICAFELYLDFINLFIRLIQLFGKRND